MGYQVIQLINVGLYRYSIFWMMWHFLFTGEYELLILPTPLFMGLPPHTWRILIFTLS